MEFGEKLQELRKSRGFTQEELAEALFVSRTAVSKWESGRGYPNIDSLKEISRFFSVTIDELLSSEKLLSIADRENKTNLQSLCGLLIGFADVFSFLLIVLPLYPKTVKGYIYAVNLFTYTETTVFNRLVDWILLLALIAVGVIEIILSKWKLTTGRKAIQSVSMILSILTVVFFALTGETYATALVFLLFLIKGMLMIKSITVGGTK